ncbi:uncharacterized protein LOC142889085 isoform X2 [Nelusetta ayraudi]|uniref:uncharacterized protein LOC142889085 isoform X2 n=1 Tax=Nelusetta ayraudi TaxID=303726 RepID=UPI003F7298E7
MPSFDLLDKVELFLRTRSFPAGTLKSAKRVTRAASKHYVYRDGLLWRSYRGRFLRVVRSDEEVRELLTRYHDNNNHAGRTRAVKEIMLMYYWVGVTEAVKNWVKACTYCQSRVPAEPPEPPVRFCLAYGCDASSYVYPNLSFHRFPKDTTRRRQWLEVAQRDEGSLRMTSCLCSRHFDPSCFLLGEDGQLNLSPDAVPTIILGSIANEVGVSSDENFLQSNTLEDLLSTAAAVETVAGPPVVALDNSESPLELLEHQYSLPASDHNVVTVQATTDYERRKASSESYFTIYNQIARYLSHRVLPMESKKSRFALKRMAKRFGLIDGVLMYTRVFPPLRVPRSREEVNSILKQFHDNQGHYGQGICQREIIKHFYWTTMTRDLSQWINNCNTCLNRTKRKWLRCSITNCKNCCGPVERGLGLTFHKFPLNNDPLLTQWIKAVGRCSWHPRLRSSICSAHFSEDCFDRGGEKVCLRPGSVPTLKVHSGSNATRDQDQAAGAEEAFFAKYDAAALYLSRRKYPPGLTYVEKNTFRRFCKKFLIKDDELHIMIKEQVLLVLRSRQQVDEALVNYHNELNHLDVNKCLRLLNERYFWKTMRSDVVKWIKNCPQCSSRKRKPAEMGAESHLEALSLPQVHDDVDSGNNDECSDVVEEEEEEEEEQQEEEEREDENEGSGRLNDEGAQPAALPEQKTLQKIPILVHLKSPISVQPNTPIIFKPRGPNTPFVARIWSFKKSGPEVQQETSGVSEILPENHSLVQVVQAEPQPEQQAPPAGPRQAGGAVTCLSAPRALALPVQTPTASGGASQSQTMPDGSVQPPEKRRRDAEAGSKKRSRCGQDPVKAPSTKPWPVFTIPKAPPDCDGPASQRRGRAPQARTVLQQCSTAKVKTKPALDGAEAEWAEIQEGMVVYVCFLQGATDDIIHDMAERLMTTKLFRKENGRMVSVLDLPGSVLLVPQESLLGRPLNRRQIQYKGGCEPWWGGHLFLELVAACRELMAASAKCTRASVKVEHGVYGPKQEMAMSSAEPLTLLLEF